MKKFFQRSVVMATGLLALPLAVTRADHQVPKNDPRINSLTRFFRASECPIEHLAAVFVREADAHHLDWRLLPGLAFVESGGGKAYRGNNVFGWNNGNSSFPSISEGIHHVATRLANARAYRSKGTSAKLATYNPNQGYSRNVKFVMQRISPARILD
jgi:hypothetical protein